MKKLICILQFLYIAIFLFTATYFIIFLFGTHPVSVWTLGPVGDMVFTVLLAGVTTFFGAFFAFKFQRDQQQAIERQQKVECGNRLLFDLYRMLENYKLLKNIEIDKVRDEYGDYYFLFMSTVVQKRILDKKLL